MQDRFFKNENGEILCYSPIQEVPDNLIPLTEEEIYLFLNPEPETEPIPYSVTARQAFIYMHRIGLLSQVEQLFSQLPQDEAIEAKIEWEKATTIERTNPLLQKVKLMMGWTAQDLDNMMLEAAKI